MNTATDIGVPIKILHESEGHNIKLETIFKDIIEGKLEQAEDNMNCHMSTVTLTKKNGNVSKMDNLYICGSQIKMVILPDALQKNALAFKEIDSGRRDRRMVVTGRGKADFRRPPAEGMIKRIEEHRRERHSHLRRVPREPSSSSSSHDPEEGHRSGGSGHRHGSTTRTFVPHHDHRWAMPEIGRGKKDTFRSEDEARRRERHSHTKRGPSSPPDTDSELGSGSSGRRHDSSSRRSHSHRDSR